jgi:hypothetical protein
MYLQEVTEIFDLQQIDIKIEMMKYIESVKKNFIESQNLYYFVNRMENCQTVCFSHILKNNSEKTR